MLRMLSSLVTAGLLLLGVALWHADEPTREHVGETVGPALERSLVVASRAAASLERELREPPPPVRLPPVPERPTRVEIEPRPAFREAPLDAVAPGGSVAPATAASTPETEVAAVDVDQDEWALLIRRMLALYDRVAGK